MTALYVPCSSTVTELTSRLKVGGSFTGITSSTDVWTEEMSFPSFDLPPLSCSWISIVTAPFWLRIVTIESAPALLSERSTTSDGEAVRRKVTV
eukprot:754545-Hanusia_phi.AAC.6